VKDLQGLANLGGLSLHTVIQIFLHGLALPSASRIKTTETRVVSITQFGIEFRTFILTAYFISEMDK